MKKIPVVVLAAAMLVVVAGVAEAKRVKSNANSACTAEIKRFCGAGGPDILRGSCLTKRMSELTPGCRNAVEEARNS